MKRYLLGSAPRLVVRAASILVPRSGRADWTAEWAAELWHVSRLNNNGAPSASPGPLYFSLGAVQDACWIRRDRLLAFITVALHRGSAARCLLALFLLTIAGVAVWFCTPRARGAMSPLPYRSSADLILISSNGYPGTQAPSIPLADYREWTTDTASLYRQIAFYQPATGQIHLRHHSTVTISLAISSDNLLRLLGISGARFPASSANAGDRPRLYLARSVWRRDYRQDPGIFGRVADVAGQSVVIAGVLPDDDWRLPGRIDAWLLEDPQFLAELPPRLKGFVVADIRDAAFPPPRAGWRSMVEMRDGVIRAYACISVDSIALQPIFSFACSLLLALLALPAITALSLGDYPRSREGLHGRLILRRWLFLATKFFLVLTLICFWSSDLAFGPASFDRSTGSGILALTSFLPLLFGFRWILQDQRRRCPVCLRLLSNPARVGQASCNFLGWSGTELICASGHGLLHIPELPTSWFSTQRWLCLDPSWTCLFTDRPPAHAETS